jgi:hypothetical protein
MDFWSCSISVFCCVVVWVMFTTTTRFVGEVFYYVAHVLLDAAFHAILPVLSTAADTYIEKVKYHGRGIRVVFITADVAYGIRAYMDGGWNVLTGEGRYSSL